MLNWMSLRNTQTHLAHSPLWVQEQVTLNLPKRPPFHFVPRQLVLGLRKISVRGKKTTTIFGRLKCKLIIFFNLLNFPQNELLHPLLLV